MSLTETEKAYIAGIIDGEGSISLVRSRARASHAFVYPLVRIANTNSELIEWIRSRVERGSVQYTSRLNIRCRDVYHWSVACRDAYAFLADIRPYLVIKAKQADVVMALDAENSAALALSGKEAFGRGNSIPQWLRHWRDACFFFVQDLNRRGVDKPDHGPQILKHIQLMKDAERRSIYVTE